ncbi:MAG: hypothetical protein ACI4CC_09525 [Lachnospiraceae bacterium]
MNKAEIMQALQDKDHKKAHDFAKQISTRSAETNEFYALFEEFINLLDAKNSYVRTRGFFLACAQARWDEDGKLEGAFDKMSALLQDEKPTVVRQCLAALHEVILYRPELSKQIKQAVSSIDPSRYKDSMAPLIERDAKELLQMIE